MIVAKKKYAFEFLFLKIIFENIFKKSIMLYLCIVRFRLYLNRKFVASNFCSFAQNIQDRNAPSEAGIMRIQTKASGSFKNHI